MGVSIQSLPRPPHLNEVGYGESTEQGTQSQQCCGFRGAGDQSRAELEQHPRVWMLEALPAGWELDLSITAIITCQFDTRPLVPPQSSHRCCCRSYQRLRASPGQAALGRDQPGAPKTLARLVSNTPISPSFGTEMRDGRMPRWQLLCAWPWMRSQGRN